MNFKKYIGRICPLCLCAFNTTEQWTLFSLDTDLMSHKCNSILKLPQDSVSSHIGELYPIFQYPIQ